MGRPPSNGAPSFRFIPTEVVEMEAVLQAHNNKLPEHEVIVSLAEKFSNSTERLGSGVQMKQVRNWFQNRRFALRAKAGKAPRNSSLSMTHNDSVTVRSAPQPFSSSTVRSADSNASYNSQMDFEARSMKDGAWYDVASFLSHRFLWVGDLEVLVRFAGLGPEEVEWVNVRRNVRQRSLPCESSDCVVIVPGDLVLCFQENKEQDLYFDARILAVERRRHDARGCRCLFLVLYDHDQCEEHVQIRKICRRPETDYRLQLVRAKSATENQQIAGAGIQPGNTIRVYPPAETAPQKQINVEVAAMQ